MKTAKRVSEKTDITSLTSKLDKIMAQFQSNRNTVNLKSVAKSYSFGKNVCYSTPMSRDVQIERKRMDTLYLLNFTTNIGERLFQISVITAWTARLPRLLISSTKQRPQWAIVTSITGFTEVFREWWDDS